MGLLFFLLGGEDLGLLQPLLIQALFLPIADDALISSNSSGLPFGDGYGGNRR